jgi:hypothetical protein
VNQAEVAIQRKLVEEAANQKAAAAKGVRHTTYAAAVSNEWWLSLQSMAVPVSCAVYAFQAHVAWCDAVSAAAHAPLCTYRLQTCSTLCSPKDATTSANAIYLTLACLFCT